MLNSIRARLTVWHTAILSVILVLFGVVVYAAMEKSLYERLDSQLANVAEVMVSSLGHEIEEHQGQLKGEAMFNGVLTTVHEVILRDSALAVFEGGRLVARKAGDGGSDPLLSMAQLPLTSGRVFTSRAGWRSVALVAEAGPAKRKYLFLLARPEAGTQSELARLRGAIMLAIPVSLFLAALGGWWMARKSLAPVVAISEVVDRITASSLHQRVETPTPSDELGKLASTFNGLLGRLEDAFEQQRQFMADAAHELRTPVSIAHTASQIALAQSHREEAQYRDSLSTIEGQMRRLGRLVQDMFLLSRADAGPLPLNSELLYLDELIAEVVRDSGVLAKAKNIHLRAEGLQETPFRGDGVLLRRLLLVLLDNAIRHTGAAGEIVVALDDGPGECRIQIRDTGKGIADEDVPHIFERFYRGEKSHARMEREAGGAGLGLAIGRSIAKAHGGTLELLSTGPEGSVFEIALPLAGDLVPGRTEFSEFTPRRGAKALRRSEV